jgi:hypothetical protein
MVDIEQTNVNNYQKIAKYFLMGLVIVCAITYIPDCSLKTMEIIMIGSISSITFALLDMIAPSITIKSNKKNKDVCIE